MQLTRYTDYSLRVLLYLAVDQNRNPPVTVDELSQQFQISRNHLVKIVHELGQRGLLLSRGGAAGAEFVLRKTRVNTGSVTSSSSWKAAALSLTARRSAAF